MQVIHDYPKHFQEKAPLNEFQTQESYLYPTLVLISS